MHLIFGGSGVMEKFCLKCGAVANETATTCPSCGAPLGQPAASAYPQAATPPPSQNPAPAQNYPPQSYPPQNTPQQNYPPPQSYPAGTFPPPPSYPPQGYPQAPPPKKTSSAVKWIVGILVTLFVLFVLVAGSIYYVFHRVKNKFEAIATETRQEDANVPPLKMPVCSLLSAEEVGAAIGVAIVDTKATKPNTCAYYAKGTPDDMVSKHMSAIMKQSGANAQQQQTIQKFTDMFKTEKKGDANQPADPNATTVVLKVDVDSDDARIAMKLVKNLLGNQPGAENISIGDEAFDSGGNALMVRKDGHLLRITYATCPCGTDEIKPLAKKAADKL
jgi:hypothetical protein